MAAVIGSSLRESDLVQDPTALKARAVGTSSGPSEYSGALYNL